MDRDIYSKIIAQIKTLENKINGLDGKITKKTETLTTNTNGIATLTDTVATAPNIISCYVTDYASCLCSDGTNWYIWVMTVDSGKIIPRTEFEVTVTYYVMED